MTMCVTKIFAGSQRPETLKEVEFPWGGCGKSNKQKRKVILPGVAKALFAFD